MSRFAQASIVIDAPLEVVWSVVSNLAGYRSWNPFVIHMEMATPGAALAPGEHIQLDARWMDTPTGKPRRTHGVVTEVKAPQPAPSGARIAVLEYRFAEWMSAAGIVTAQRRQTLQELPDGRTEYVSREDFGGLLNALVPLKRVQAGFDAHAAALKAEAERLAKLH